MKTERFRSIEEKRVKMLICGPTVYDNIHLGHARTFVTFDVLARFLTYMGHDVRVVVNVTDRDRKITERAKYEGLPPDLIAGLYLDEFKRDLTLLGISTFNDFFRVSEQTGLAARLVRTLIERGQAYSAGDNVYLRNRWGGKLFGISERELRLMRIELDPLKREQSDIKLWTAEARGETGGPSWHMQDASVAVAALGGRYDVHGGAIDLIYPHHRSYVKIMEALLSDRSPARYWVHVGLLLYRGRKMSKSIGNVVEVKSVMKRFSPEALRLYLLSHHYRDELDFSIKGLTQACSRYREVSEVLSSYREELLELDEKGPHRMRTEMSTRYLREFMRSISDDLNTPEAIESLMALCSSMMRREASTDHLLSLREMCEVLGIPAARDR